MHSMQILVALLKTVSASPRKIPASTRMIPTQREIVAMIFCCLSDRFIEVSCAKDWRGGEAVRKQPKAASNEAIA